MSRFAERIDDVVPQGRREQGEQITPGRLVFELALHVLLQNFPREIFNRKTDAGNGGVRPTEPKVGEGSPSKSRQAEGQVAKIHRLLLRQVGSPGQLVMT